jgi:elongation factor Tu
VKKATSLKNMITGASQMDGAILVVSAPDGIQVQTREHIILAKEIGLQFIIVFVNKVDRMADEEMVELLELEILELLGDYGFGDKNPVDVVKGSALKALEGDKKYLDRLYKLMDLIDEKLPQPNRVLDAPFLMPIESVVVAQGRGTVVTGKIERGLIKIGLEVDVLSKKIYNTVCMGIEMYHKILDEGQAGDNVGILLKNIPNKDVHRGDVLAAPNSVQKKQRSRARVYILTEKEGGRKSLFNSGYKPQFFFRINNVSGSILLEETQEAVMPGDNVTFIVDLAKAVVINVGLRFVMREGKLTIGAGIITEIL